MIKVKNIFGDGELAQEQDLEGSIFAQCTACTSIYAEYLSWANNRNNSYALYPVRSIEDAENVVILSCQVTDLAVLNDLMTLETLREKYLDKRFWVGGCLARRFDIELPKGVGRLDALRHDGQFIYDLGLVGWNKPFWVENFDEDDDGEGHLFRDMYPLRIGVGCNRKCTYCTIKTTRGTSYQLDVDNLEREFLAFADVVLIADSPSEQQVIDWCEMATHHGKTVSFRNVEPATVMQPEVTKALEKAAYRGLLHILHTPIQSDSPDTLKDMGRPVKETLDYINKMVPKLSALGVEIATNVIIDYKDFPNPTSLGLFDHVAWNPYWNGLWNRQEAERRWNHYFPWSKV